MKPRILIRLLLVLGIAGVFFLYEAPGEQESTTAVSEAVPSGSDHKITFVSPVRELPPADTPIPPPDPRLEGLDPEQVAKLAPLRDALERLGARAKEQAARREGAVLAPAGEPVPAEEAEAPGPFPTDKEGIQSAIREAIPRVKECYEAWLQANPELAGKLTVSFRIEGDPEAEGLGKIAQAEVKESGLGNAFLDGCVVASLADLTFEAPPPEGLSVTYPFLFRAAETP